MQQLLNNLGMMIRPHFYEIAMMIVATLLVIYGNEINKMVKRRSHWHFPFQNLSVCGGVCLWLRLAVGLVYTGFSRLAGSHTTSVCSVSTIGIVFCWVLSPNERNNYKSGQ